MIIGKGPDYNSQKMNEIFQGKDNDFSIAVHKCCCWFDCILEKSFI